jgi:hypothetical protein
VLGRDRIFFVKKKTTDSTKKFSETDIINMLQFLIDNIFVIFGGRVFQQTVGIAMGTTPVLADLFLYSYEADFIQGLLKKNEKKLARFINFTFRYIDDVLPLYNSRFGNFVDRIYPIEFEIKDTAEFSHCEHSNIPAASAYGVYISQLIRYSRACGSYQDFLDRGLLLTRKILNQGFLLVKLKSSLRKFYGPHK